MTQRGRHLASAAVLVLVFFAGWRIYALMQAERFVADPVRALRWIQDEPSASLALAQAQLNGADPQAAAATARRLLLHEPVQGEGCRVLADALAAEGHDDKALPLYRIAARRAPRDARASSMLVAHHLAAGEYPQALALVDRMVRIAPARTKAVNAILGKVAPLAQDPRFAEALIPILIDSPPWRSAMLVQLGAYPDAYAHVMQGLLDSGELDAEALGRWINGLIARGQWGEAYARWAAATLPGAARIPLFYNGDFSRTPTGVGFDWHLQQVPGVLATFEPVAGLEGNALHLQFLDQRVADAGLEHPLMLFTAASYRFEVRMRAEALRGAIGMQWVLACAGKAGIIARSDPLVGTWAWKPVRLDFTIPVQGCPGQWLRLVNPVANGAGQRISGQLWVGDVTFRHVAPQ